MFFINKIVKVQRKEVFFYHVIPALLLFVLISTITIVYFFNAQSAKTNELRNVIEAKNTEIVNDLKLKLSSYEDILIGGTGLFSLETNVSRQIWNDYIGAYNLSNNYPGTLGIGFVRLMSQNELEDHINEVRKADYPNYEVTPLSNEDYISSVLFIVPPSEENTSTIGYNMYSEKDKREAMERAALSGRTAIVSPVQLIQDQKKQSSNVGLLMYQPVYKNKNLPKNINNTYGFVYAPLKLKNTIETSNFTDENNYKFKITANNNVLYKSNNFDQLASENKNFYERNFKLDDGTTWRITGVASEQILRPFQEIRPYALLIVGMLLAVSLAGFLYVFLINRTQSIMRKEEEELQQAKDELVALASHQLRTPATSVKQYLGMLIEGFAGALNDDQIKLINKAYKNNDRQLNIINEILIVAQADSGQLKMTLDKVNLNELISEIVSDQKRFAKLKRNFYVSLPKKIIEIKADKNYLRMAIDNIVNNAVKYTKDNGKIKVKLTKSKNYVYITISDNGVGVAQRDQPLLFKKFSRIPNELSTKVSGSGMGLYLARKIVRLHKGKVAFISEEQQGTKVIIKIPASG